MSLMFRPESFFIRSLVSLACYLVSPIFLLVALMIFKTIGHSMAVRSLCFSPDSQYLITASDDKKMNIYDV